MKKIVINIPSIPDFKDLLKERWAILKFRVNGGFKCDRCGTPKFYKTPDYTSEIKGRRFILGSGHSPANGLCAKCLWEDALKRNVWKSREPCDWCGTKKNTTKWFNPLTKMGDPHITFGAEWWNGFHICKECFAEALNGAKDRSSHLVYDKKDKKTYYVNELGLKDKRNTF